MCFVCVGSLLYAQNCDEKIFGVVYDLHDNLPLEGVSVTLVENNSEIQTIANGKFVFTGLCEQSYMLLLEHPDCVPVTIKVNSPSSILKRFYLEHHLNELEEIIITEVGQKKESKTGIESNMSSQEINRFRTQSLGDALQQLSGVSGIKTGNAIVKPVVHGVSGSRLAIVNDGIRLQDHEWGADHAPSIDINGANQVQLIKGATALKYGGDAIGGVLQILPKRHLLKDSLFGSVSSAYQSQGRGRYAFADLTKTYQAGNYFGVNTSFKGSGDLESPNYVLSNTGNKEQHAKIFFGRNTITQEWRFDYRFFSKETGILAAAHLGTIGDLARSIQAGEPLVISPWTREIKNPRQTTAHHTASFRYERRMTNNAKWDIRYSYQNNNRKEFDLRRGSFKNQAALDLVLQSHDLQFNLRSKPENDLQWHSGFSAQLQDNYSNPATGVRRLIPDYLRYKLGAYAVSEYIPSNNFTAEIGVRYDYDRLDAQKFYRITDWDRRGYSSEFQNTIISTTSAGNYLTQQLKEYGNLSASLGIKQALAENTFVFMNLGYINRSPNPSELFSDGLHHALATIELGELRLKQERAIKGLFSVEKNKGKLRYSLVAYWSKVSDYIVLEPTEEGIDQARNSAFLVRQYRQLPDVNLSGLDADISYRFSEQFSWSSSAAWINGKQKNGEALIDIPPFNLSNKLTIYPIKDHPLELRLTSEYVGEQTAFPDRNFSYNFLTDGIISSALVDISTPPSAYHLMGLELSTRIPLGIEVRLVVDNIFDTEYRNYLNRLRYFTADTGRNLRLELSYTF